MCQHGTIGVQELGIHLDLTFDWELATDIIVLSRSIPVYQYSDTHFWIMYKNLGIQRVSSSEARPRPGAENRA